MIGVIIWLICGVLASIIFLTIEIKENNYNTYDKFKDFLFGYHEDGLFYTIIVFVSGCFSLTLVIIYLIGRLIGEKIYKILYKLSKLTNQK